MKNKRSAGSDGAGGSRRKCSLKMVIALFCLSLIMGGPHVPLPHHGSLGTKAAAAQQGDTTAGDSTGTATDDTPSDEAISDFASEYDKDGDGEVDEPADEEADDEQDAGDEADQDDDNDDDQDDDRDDDLDGQENIDDDDETGDTADTREDVDGDVNPDYRVSGFNRYPLEKRLRRLGEFNGLTPLIEREETLLFEN